MKQIYTPDDNMDDLFRKSLEGHRVEPDPVIWKGISRKLLWKEIIRFNFKNVRAGWWKAGIIGGLAVSIAGYLLWPETTAETDSRAEKLPRQATTTAVHSGNISDPEIRQTARMQSLKKDQNGQKPAPPALQQGITKSSPVKQPAAETLLASATRTAPKSRINAVQSTTVAHVPTTATTTSIPEWAEPNPEPFHNQAVSVNQLQSIDIMEMIRPEMLQISGKEDSIIAIRTVGGEAKLYRWRSGYVPGMISVSAGIIPELSFYQGTEKYTKSNYWVHGSVTYHISRFEFTTGMELGYMLDKGKYQVEYKSQDSVGYFANVVSYTIGSGNEISFTTRNTTIYDSLLHADDYRTSNRYTYLRIPALFGIRVFESDRFSVGIHTGAAVSFLLGKKESEPVIDYPNARIIRIGEETPGRLKTNWQLWANLRAEMKVTPKIGLYVEPSFKYFMKPTAEQEGKDANPPWSIGLGIGLQFNFEPKRNAQ